VTDELAEVRLTPRAEADLEDIWRNGAAEWSPEQEDRYIDGLVAVFAPLRSMPRIARERTEVTPPVRIHPSGPHLVIYRIAAPHLEILRIVGGRQDWQRLLQVLE
jgi:toxin ParE1/3/4